MYPARILSINGSWDKLHNEKIAEWMELERLLNELTTDLFSNDDLLNSMVRRPSAGISISTFVGLWNALLEREGWKRSRRVGSSSVRLRNIKNRVASQMLTSEYMSSDFPSLMLATLARVATLDICDVFVLLVPTDDFVEKFHNGLRSTRYFSESVCRKQLYDLLPLLPNLPVVIIFFSLEYELVEIENIVSANQYNANINYVERSIEFAPEYYQAGVGVLSYFGEILRQKYPDVNARVRIEQQGNVVRMHIETPGGEINIVEKELELYAMVIKKQAPIESLLQDRLQIMALENKLEIAQMEIRQAYKMLDLSESLNATQRKDYEQEVGFLRVQIGEALQLATRQTASHERIQIAQISHASSLFKDVVGEANGNQVVLNALRSLEYNLMSGIALIDVQDKIEASLNEVRQTKPGILNHIAGQIESGAYGAAAGYALEWIKLHANS